MLIVVLLLLLLLRPPPLLFLALHGRNIKMNPNAFFSMDAE
jgi:hypothetical protein